MSGTLKRNCFWMTIIKSNPGDEFYCEGPDKDECYFNCDNCEWFISQDDMQCIFLHIIDLFREYLPRRAKLEAEPTKHGRWSEKHYCSNLTGYDYAVICSECEKPTYRQFAEPTPNYCPNCGAKMDEVEE